MKLALNEQSAPDNLLFSGGYKPKDRHLTCAEIHSEQY